ncbi:unnamed protein product [Adineta ricciae]|uniref:Clathrin light chain n=1 Tax=Adineta ricciae TaxID=249248 RepID=A0A815SBC6_ADIRI|nr:unnamed protein product [Adineta ricciae]
MASDDPFNSNSTNIDGNSANNFYNFNDEDPAAEFIQREQLELGDITGQENSNSFMTQLSNNALLTNGNYSATANQDVSASPTPSSGSQYQALSELNEPETIRKWREEFAARIEKKDTEEEVKRKEMREQAKKELEEFHKQRVEQLERTKGQNRTNNRAFEDDLLNNGKSSSTSNGKVSDWDKITSLCEFNPKTNRSQKDLTRYRSVLLQLKQQQTSGK